jgi:hypothetical protein
MRFRGQVEVENYINMVPWVYLMVEPNISGEMINLSAIYSSELYLSKALYIRAIRGQDPTCSVFHGQL